jgi:hypothetical protein
MHRTATQRTGRAPRLLSAALVAVLALAAPAGAQGVRTEKPAIVNGESITAEDIGSYARLLGEERSELSPADALHLARRSVAEEILLAAETARLGVVLDDRTVDEYWERRRGIVPDYEALARQAGTKVERQRTLARRAAQAELYLLHRTGMRNELSRAIPPDPLLVRLVTITPSQLREAFASNRRFFDVPDTVECDVYPCTDDAAAQAALAALMGGQPVTGVQAIHRSYPVPALPELFTEDLAAFLREGTVGQSRAFIVSDGTLVVQIAARHPGRAAGFAESQEKLRTMLLNELLTEARRHLVTDLAQHATYYPPELFSAPAGTPPAPAAGATSGDAPGGTTAPEPVPMPAPEAGQAPVPMPGAPTEGTPKPMPPPEPEPPAEPK